MNIAHEEKEKRGLLRLHLVTFSFTIGSILIGILFLVSVGVVPAVLAFLNLEQWAETLVEILRWRVLLIVIVAAISLIRFGPSRERPQCGGSRGALELLRWSGSSRRWPSRTSRRRPRRSKHAFEIG